MTAELIVTRLRAVAAMRGDGCPELSLSHAAANCVEQLLAEKAELLASCESFRDSVLHQRWNLEDNGMTSDQINDVLNLFDTLIGDEIAKVGAV